MSPYTARSPLVGRMDPPTPSVACPCSFPSRESAPGSSSLCCPADCPMTVAPVSRPAVPAASRRQTENHPGGPNPPITIAPGRSTMPYSFRACGVGRWMMMLLMTTAWTNLPAQPPAPPVRVAIVGLAHDHVIGFLQQLPQHSEVELVGIAEADSTLIDKYKNKFHLADTLFFKSEANMIEVRHPQAVLVYTSIAEHRHAIGIAAQYGVSSMVEKPLTISLRGRARHPQDRPLPQGPRAGELRNHLVRQQSRRLQRRARRAHRAHPPRRRPRRPRRPQRDRRQSRILPLAHRSGAERRRRALRLRLLRRRPDDLAHARRNARQPSPRSSITTSRTSIPKSTTTRPSSSSTPKRRPSSRPRGTGRSAARTWKSTAPPATSSP